MGSTSDHHEGAAPAGAATVAPPLWYATLPAPALERATGGELDVVLRCFAGTDAAMDKPALCENLVCVHQGGPKRVHRWQNGRHHVWDVPLNAVSLMPMFRDNRWLTEGPVAFTHLTLSPGLLARYALEEFGHDPKSLAVIDRVGVPEPLIAGSVLALAESLRDDNASRLYRESLVTAIAIRILSSHSTVPASARGARLQGGLAGWQLRRVVDYMAAHLDEDLGVAGMVRLTGLSRGHFFRAFRQSTGDTPARYLLRLRLDRARERLAGPAASLEEVARSVGFSGVEPFARAFRRTVGVTPAAWRRRHRPPAR